MHYVYILRCNDNTFYTGYTNNLNKRIQTHNASKGAKYTRGRLPVKLVYFEEYSSKIQAMQREYAIKQLTKENKLKIIQSNKNLK